MLLDLEVVKKRARMWAEKNPLVRSLVIYGSYAKGNARPESDLDLAVDIWPARRDSDSATTWMLSGTKWQRELAALLEFPKVHLEWLDADGDDTPTVEAGVNESAIEVYRRR